MDISHLRSPLTFENLHKKRLIRKIGVNFAYFTMIVAIVLTSLVIGLCFYSAYYAPTISQQIFRFGGSFMLVGWNIFLTVIVAKTLGRAYYELDSERYTEFRKAANQDPSIKTYLFRLLDTQKEITYGNYEDVCVYFYLESHSTELIAA